MPAKRRAPDRLAPDHNWKAERGNAILALDQGAIRFEFPDQWKVQQRPKSVRIFDQDPPHASCSLEVARMYLPPDSADLPPLGHMLRIGLQEDEFSGEVLDRLPVVETRRGDLQIAWADVVYLRKSDHRESTSRTCLARTGILQCLLTFEFPVEDQEWLEPIWSRLIDSLVLDWVVDDPAKGPVVH